MKPSTSLQRAVAFVVLLSSLYRSEPALADGCLVANFQTAPKFDTGPNPVFVAAGDFNGDGKPDLAVANAGTNNVSVLLGKGDGTFHTAVNYAAGAQPRSVAVADFNGDGKADLVGTGL